MTKAPTKTESATAIGAFEPSLSQGDETLCQVIKDLLPLFRVANIFLGIALTIIFVTDVVLILAGMINASQRIIDQTVVIALIVGVAAEISVIIIAAIRRIC